MHIGGDGNVEGFQVAVIDGKPGGPGVIGPVPVPKAHADCTKTGDSHARRSRHRELIARRRVGFVGVIRIGIDAKASVWFAVGELAEVLVGEFQILNAEMDFLQVKVGIHGHVQAFQFAVIDGKPRGPNVGHQVPVPEGHAEVSHATNAQAGRARHRELIIARNVGTTGISSGPNAGSAVLCNRHAVHNLGGNLAEVLVGEFQITDPELDTANREAGIQGHVQAFQVAVIDGQAGCYHAVAVVAEGHADRRIHAAQGHGGRARHHELVVGCVVGLCCVGVTSHPGVINSGSGIVGNPLGRGRGIEMAGHLAEVLVGELQVLNGERNPADTETGIHRQVQALQLAAGNDQAWGAGSIGIGVAERGAQVGDAAHGNSSRACQRVRL